MDADRSGDMSPQQRNNLLKLLGESSDLRVVPYSSGGAKFDKQGFNVFCPPTKPTGSHCEATHVATIIGGRVRLQYGEDAAFGPYNNRINLAYNRVMGIATGSDSEEKPF